MIIAGSVSLSRFAARRISPVRVTPLPTGATHSVSIGKVMALAFALRLAAKHHGNAESVIIMLKVHCQVVYIPAPCPGGGIGRRASFRC
jgi:hypothetical protein